jgi:acyl-CoA synthetase (AMP-forming)/AMP-acid ligase II/outer membrane protein assembly factor BamB
VQVEDAKPVAAVVVGDSDDCLPVALLSKADVFKCSLLTPVGTLSHWDATVTIASEESASEGIEWEKLRSGEDKTALYILYTSGSTGRPKGVMGSYVGLINRLCWQYTSYPWEGDEIACRRTPLTFVDSLAEIFSPLLAGIPIWTPENDVLVSEGILGVASRGSAVGATRITLLPSQLYSACVSSPRKLSLIWPRLKYVFISGEECYKGLVSLFKASCPGAYLINLYGSTEIAGDVAVAELSTPLENGDCGALSPALNHIDCVPIGRAIPGNEIFVVSYNDDVSSGGCFAEVADGAVGELLVVGVHIALGYRTPIPDSTAQFIDSAWLSLLSGVKVKISRGFLTGDLACKIRAVDDHENYYFTWVGRKDRMIKIHGVRVELEDVERSICNLLGIFDGVAAVDCVDSIQSMHGNDAANSTSLILFVDRFVLNHLQLNSGLAMKGRIAGGLPSVMVPSYIIPLPQMPHNTTGKIDRNRLKIILRRLKNATAKQEILSLEDINREKISNNPSTEQATNVIFEIYKSVIPNLILNLYQATDVKQAVFERLLIEDQTYSQTDVLAFCRDNTFFSLGGDSMSSVLALWRLRNLFGNQLTIKEDILTLPIIEIAEKLQHAESGLCSASFISASRNVADEEVENPAKRIRLEKSIIIHETGNSAASTTAVALKVLREFMPSLCVYRDRAPRLIDDNIFLNSPDLHGSRSQALSLRSVFNKQLRKCVDSSPILVISKEFDKDKSSVTSCDVPILYVGSHAGDFYAINGSTGDELWKAELGEHIEGSAVYCDVRDIFETGNGFVLVPSFSGADIDGFESQRSRAPRGTHDEFSKQCLGALWCIDAVTGEILWYSCTQGEIKGSPLIDVTRALAYVGSHDGNLYCFALATGKLLNSLSCGGPIYATPKACSESSEGINEICITTTHGLLHVVSLGNKDSQYSMHIIFSFSSAGSPMFTSAIYFSNYIVTGVVNGRLVCIERKSDADTGRSIWVEKFYLQVASGPIFSNPNFCFRQSKLCVLFGSHDGYLRLFSIESGSEIWNVNLGSAIFASPFCCYFRSNGNSSECVGVVCTTSGRLSVVNLSGGEVLSSLILPGEIYSSPIIGIENSIYVGCRDDRIHCLRLE